MTWTALTSVDAVDVKRQILSPPEACLVAGISIPRLLTWHTENLVPEPRDLTGRGFRRKYNVAQLAHLIAMRVLSDRGVQLSDHHKPLEATAHLVELVARMILGALDDACDAPSAEAAKERSQTTIVIADSGDESYRFETFYGGRLLRGVDDPDGPDMISWMQGEGIADAIIIAPMALGCALRIAIEDLVANRGTPLLRKKLADHQARFRRRPPQKRKPVRVSKRTRQ